MNKLKNFKKEILIIGILTFFIFILMGCSRGYENIEKGIISPEKDAITVEGFYKISEVISLEEDKFVDERSYKNFSVEFNLKEARVGIETIMDPQYKSKSVSTYDFFSKEYMVPKDNLNIKEDRMVVTSIKDNDKNFYDVYQLNEEDIMIVKGNNLLKLKKITNESLIEKTRKEQKEINSNIEIDPKAGVLIGLKGKRDEESLKREYRTLWITSDGEYQELYEMENIVFPRKDFFKLEVVTEIEKEESREDSDSVENNNANKAEAEDDENLTLIPLELIEISPIQNGKSEKNIMKSKKEGYINIDFVGNNYIGISTLQDKKERPLERKIIDIDKLKNLNGVHIETFYKDPGIEEFDAALINEGNKKDILKYIDLEDEERYKSFYIKRYKGSWMIKNRVNLKKDSEIEKEYIDIPIALKPKRELVTYDELNISWDEIIEKVPQAVDAFLAPKNSFVLIRTPKYLIMYKLRGLNKLDDEPTEIIEIKEEEEIIMAEWANGDFVERWTETVKTIGQKIIFVQNPKLGK